MDMMESMLRMIEEGERSIVLSKNQNVTALLGLTGTGKTTLALLLTGDNTRLTAVPDGTVNYIIRDEKEKISSATDAFTSKTAIPELMIDNTTGTVLYDMPGFEDTRNSSTEIATMFYIKKVLSHAERVKLVFAVNYNNAVSGRSRDEFSRLLNYATVLIRNVTKFEDSIGMVLTRGDLIPHRKNKILVVPSVNAIVQDAGQKLRSTVDNIESLTESEKQLVRVLTTQLGNDYTRLSIFSNVNEAGPLSNNTRVQEEKERIKRMIDNNLAYTVSNGNDFGYPLSKAAKHDISRVFQDITDTITGALESSTQRLVEYNTVWNRLWEIKYDDEKSILTKLEELLRNVEGLVGSSQDSFKVGRLVKNLKQIESVVPDDVVNDTFDAILQYVEKTLGRLEGNTWNELRKGYDRIKLYEKSYVVLILGNSGDLIVTRDVIAQTVTYQIPGFGSTRVPSEEIAAIASIKAVTDLAWGIKFLFVVNDNNFSDLIEKASKLMPNIEPYKDSIGLANNLANASDILNETRDKLIGNKNALKLVDLLSKKIDPTFAPFVQGSLKFADCTSSESLRRVDEIMKDVNEEIRNDLGPLLAAIEVHYTAKQEHTDGISKLQDLLFEASIKIMNTLEIVRTNGTSPREFGNELNNLFVDLGIQSPGNYLSGIKDKNDQVEFLRTFEVESSGWISPLEELYVRIDGIDRLYDVFGRIQSRLLEYDIQYDWSESNQTALNEILWDLEGFFKKIANGGEEIPHDSIKNMAIDETQRNLLSRVVGSSFPKDNSISCIDKSKELLIKGSFLRTSAIEGAHNCSFEIEGYKIFAKRIILVDSDIDTIIRGKKLTIIAPTWVVKGTKGIVLNGSDFFGVGFKFYKSENLYVTTTNGSRNTLIELDGESYINGKSRGSGGLRQSSAINAYKLYLTGNLDNLADRKFLLRIVDELYTNVKILQLYDADGFIDEIMQLEESFEFNPENNSVESYESLMKRIKQYYAVAGKNVNAVLQYAYVSSSSKVWALKHQIDKNLIIDLKTYLELVVDNLKELKGDKRIGEIKIHVEEYNHNVEDEIKLVTDFMTNTLEPYLNQTEIEINRNITSLLKEIEQRQIDIKAKNKKLAEEKDKFQRIFPIKTALKVMASVAEVSAAFLGPVGVVVAGVAGTALTVAQNFLPAQDDSLLTTVQQLPDNVRVALDRLGPIVRKRKEERVKILQRQIDLLKSSNITEFQVIINKLKVVQTPWTKIGVDKLKKVFEDFDEVVEKVGGKLKDKALKVSSALKKIAPLVETVGEVVGDTMKFENSIGQFDAVIEHYEKQYKQYEIFKYVVDDILVTGFDEMTKFQGGVIKKMSQGVRVPLVDQWSMETQLVDMQKQMKRLSDGFKVNQDIIDLWDKMDNAFERLNKCYDQIQARYKEEKLSKLMLAVGANVANAVLSPELNSNLISMILHIKYNVVYGQYNKVVRALKQASFPFEVDDFSLDPTREGGIDEMIDLVSQKINKLKEGLIISESTTTIEDDHTVISKFSSRPWGDDPAFYLWENKEHGRDIRKLIAGEEIILLADITRSMPKNVVKFSKIELLFNGKNDSVQDVIDNIEPSLKIEIRHSGVSHYKCGNQVYSFFSRSVALDHSFNTWSENEQLPTTHSETYEKLAKARPILSPYTAWTIRFREYRDSQKRILSKYENEIDLELAGSGSYVSGGKGMCPDDLKDRYPIDLELSRKLNARDVLEVPPSWKLRAGGSWLTDCHGTLMLLDLLARNITGESRKSFDSSTAGYGMEDAAIGTINLVDKFEEKLKVLLSAYRIPSKKVEFDSYALIEPLKSSLLANNCQEARQLLHDSVRVKLSKPKMDRFDKDLRRIIEKLLN